MFKVHLDKYINNKYFAYYRQPVFTHQHIVVVVVVEQFY